MSARNILGNTKEFKSLGNKTIPPTFNNAVTWYRNPSWLPLPTVLSSEDKFVGLYAIFPASNFISLRAQGNYTVDFGDGTIQNFSSSSNANYEYQFSDVDLNNTNAPVTFQQAGNTVTRSNHGYKDGMTVSFSSITTTTGITAEQIYYVIEATTNTFKVSETPGGNAIILTNNGAGIILPYKQVIVTVTPQAGQSITSLNLNVRNNAAGSPNVAYTSGWLDIALSLPSCTSLTISNQVGNVLFNLLEQVNLINVSNVSYFYQMFWNCRKLNNLIQINSSNITNVTGMFINCVALQKLPLFNTANVTSMADMFGGCASLQTVPLFNTQNVTNMSGMFSGCRTLQTVPLFNTQNVTNMFYMFGTCASLQTVPLFNTQNVTNMSSMFTGCSALQTVPTFNTVKVTTMNSMFQACGSLQTVPQFNTGTVTNFSNMFASCVSLREVPQLNTAIATDMSSMFNSCQSLQTVPLLNTANVTNMSSMFNGCITLIKVPTFNTVKVTTMNSMFQNAFALQTLSQLNGVATTSSSSYSNMFATCSSLSDVNFTNFKFTFSLLNCKLSATALNAIYTSLPSVTGQTITVTGNYGTISDNPAIATAKGWTVTG